MKRQISNIFAHKRNPDPHPNQTLTSFMVHTDVLKTLQVMSGLETS